MVGAAGRLKPTLPITLRAAGPRRSGFLDAGHEATRLQAVELAWPRLAIVPLDFAALRGGRFSTTATGLIHAQYLREKAR
jgi:hypothetical protein